MNFVAKPEFKLMCESCGSLTVVPIGSNPRPAGSDCMRRCGSPRGTLLIARKVATGGVLHLSS
jgi:hypothetical protein